MLLRAKVYNSYTTANRRILDWIAMGELHKLGHQQKGYYVTLKGFNKGETNVIQIRQEQTQTNY